MKRDDWAVGDEGIRPAGRPDACFYCKAPLCGTHDPTCVIRKRTVVVKVEAELVMDVPESWDARMIEFYANDGTSCASDLIDKLSELDQRLEEAGSCPCSLVRLSYLREATPEDEQTQRKFVSDLPS